jgi:hypothetical protein
MQDPTDNQIEHIPRVNMNRDDQLNLVVIYKKQPYSVLTSSDETIQQLKEKLESLTLVPIANQKLMLKGLLKDNTATLSQAGITNNTKLMLIGSTVDEVKDVQKSAPESKLPFERPKPKGPKVAAYSTRKYQSSRIGRIDVLDLPNADKARAILERLANDRGIAALLEKYNWNLGVLKELSPSVTHLLGYNENKGQSIALRLRFEDGFRAYSSIRSVMFHELAHNHWSEHDDNFHRFNRQLQREAKELDWTESTGNVVGGTEVYRPIENEEVEEVEVGDDTVHAVMQETAKSSGQALGGAIEGNFHRNVKPSLLAYEAAICRLSAQEKEITESCGSGKINNTNSTNTTNNTHSNLEEERSINEKRKREQNSNNTKQDTTKTPNLTTPSTVTNTNTSTATKTNVNTNTKAQTKTTTSHNTNTKTSINTNQEREREAKRSKNVVPASKPSEWSCAACTFINSPTNKTCEICGTSVPTTNTTTTTTPTIVTTTSLTPSSSSTIFAEGTQPKEEGLSKELAWICGACTFLNKHATHNCAMCNSPNPSAS